MSHSAPIDIDCKSPPFDQFRSIHRLAAARSGHAFGEHGRHQLYVARDKRSRANVLIKVTSKPGLVYERDLTNEPTIGLVGENVALSAVAREADGRLRRALISLEAAASARRAT